MATTPHLALSLLAPSQAQKEVTVNEALFRLDAILNSGAISRGTNAPPSSPQEGDLYIIGSAPTGLWAGKAQQIAYFQQIWRFIMPNAGMMLWVIADNQHVVYNGTSWNIVLTGATSWTTVNEQTVTAGTAVDVTSLGGFDAVRISASLSVSTAAALQIRTSNDNGTTFYSAASDYIWGHAGTSGNEHSLAASAMRIGTDSVSTNRKIAVEMTQLADANLPTIARYHVLHEGTFQLYQGMAYRAANVAENAIRFFTSAGTMTGRIKVEAM